MENKKFISIVDLANRYCYCVNILNGRGGSELQNIEERMRVVFPVITFGCLTCEMYLKALAYKNSGELHIFDATFTDKSNENSNAITKTFIVKLLEGTDFVMSFNV